MTKETIGTEELSATVEKDDKTIQMENGKEVRLNFMDTGNREQESQEAKQAGVEESLPSIKDIAENLHGINRFLSEFSQDAARLNVELSALITVLMRRGVITADEMQEGIKAVVAQLGGEGNECGQCNDEKSE